MYPSGVPEISEDLRPNELVRRLAVCAEALHNINQDATSAAVFRPLAYQLCSEFFLEHPSKEVKILSAWSLAELLRIFAPDAPYDQHANDENEQTIKHVLQFFVQQLRGLEHPNDALFRRYFSLLENLAVVKSLNIALELSDPDEIVCELFRVIFHIVGVNPSERLQALFLDIMVPLICDADTVSTDLLDRIFVCLIEPRKTQDREAYCLATELLKRCQDSLEIYVQNFFNSILLLGQAESEVADFVYPLIYEVQMIAPTLLNSVLPQLEMKLQSSEAKERKDSIRLMARLFSEQQLYETQQNLWSSFLGRFKDVDVDVRKLCVKSSVDFLLKHPSIRQDVTDALALRLRDPDEVVRLEAIRAVAGAAKRDLSSVADSLLEGLKERTLDKKFKVRKESLLCLGQIYRNVLIHTATFTEIDVARVDWIRNKILHMYYQNCLEDRLFCERLMNTCLVPYVLEVKERMSTLHRLYCSVDEHAVRAFNEITKQQFLTRTLLRRTMELIRQEDTEEKEASLVGKLTQLAEFFTEPHKTVEHFKQFFKVIAEDQRTMKLVDQIVAQSNTYTCKKIEECVTELLHKLDPSTPLAIAVKALMERAAPVTIDAQAIETLVYVVSRALSGELRIPGVSHSLTVERSLALLHVLCCAYPHCFKQVHVLQELLQLAKRDHPLAGATALEILYNVGSVNDFSQLHADMLALFKNCVLKGTPKQAKYAVLCVHRMFRNDQETIFEQYIEMTKRRLKMDDPQVRTALSALASIAHLCPVEFSRELKALVVTVARNVIMSEKEHTCEHGDASYVPFDEVSTSTQAKIQGIKFMVRYLLGLRSNDDNMGTRCLKFLATIIAVGGDLKRQPRFEDSAHAESKGAAQKSSRRGIESPCAAECAHLRLAAAVALLKVLREKIFVGLLTLEQYHWLAYVMTDEVHEVRVTFVKKLNKGLVALRLPLEYMAAFSLVGLLKNSSSQIVALKKEIRTAILHNIARRRDVMRKNKDAQSRPQDFLPEYSLCYAVHLLAHHPAFKTHKDAKTLNFLKEALWFLMEPLTVTKHNDQFSFQFLYKLFQCIKQARDAQAPNDDNAAFKLWALADVGMALVTYRTHNFALRDYPAKAVLCTRFFTNINRKENNVQVYAPFQVVDEEKRHKNLPKRRPGLGVSDEIVEAPEDSTSDHDEVEEPRTAKNRATDDEDGDVAISQRAKKQGVGAKRSDKRRIAQLKKGKAPSNIERIAPRSGTKSRDNVPAVRGELSRSERFRRAQEYDRLEGEALKHIDPETVPIRIVDIPPLHRSPEQVGDASPTPTRISARNAAKSPRSVALTPSKVKASSMAPKLTARQLENQQRMQTLMSQVEGTSDESDAKVSPGASASSSRQKSKRSKRGSTPSDGDESEHDTSPMKKPMGRRGASSAAVRKPAIRGSTAKISPTRRMNGDVSPPKRPSVKRKASAVQRARAPVVPPDESEGEQKQIPSKRPRLTRRALTSSQPNESNTEHCQQSPASQKSSGRSTRSSSHHASPDSVKRTSRGRRKPETATATEKKNSPRIKQAAAAARKEFFRHQLRDDGSDQEAPDTSESPGKAVRNLDAALGVLDKPYSTKSPGRGAKISVALTTRKVSAGRITQR